MNREEITKKLLEEMCLAAENADRGRGRGVPAWDIQFKPFKPGVNDKLYFKMIIDECWENLENELKTIPPEKHDGSCRICALSLLNLFYAPHYLTPEERVLDREEAERRRVALRDYLVETKKKEINDLRRKLLEQMCSVAGLEGVGVYEITEPLPNGKEITEFLFGVENPVFFHPGSGDKLIFRLILDKVIASIYSEDRTRTNKKIIAMNIMKTYYFPDYSEFDRQQLAEAKGEIA